ncbi:MAG: FKBP-type peptidyl-prolyl cis-trans isomerase [Bacteroidales bacterium]|nr:FKBP-type peptidyl-prolyl cis-trans isomerase [Bacteroidales bacterium]
MKNGGKLTLISPSNQAFGEKGVTGYIPPYSPVVYEIEIIDVFSADEMKAKKEKAQVEALAAVSKQKNEEYSKIDAYLSANRITTVPTASGLIYIEEQAGNGELATAGQKVKVHYTGYLLNGKKFDSSVDRGQPFEFTVGQGQVIAGWDEAFTMISVGGKAKIILPSNIAYGERGAGGDIPPYSPLVFEVELLEIIK